MPILQARIQTERASRFLVQFCKHAAAMGSGDHTARMHLHRAAPSGVRVTADWSDTGGTVTFIPWGRCTFTARKDALDLRVYAEDEDGATRIRDVITRDFERFTRRDPVTVTWQRDGDASVPSGNVVTAAPVSRSARLGLSTVLLVRGEHVRPTP